MDSDDETISKDFQSSPEGAKYKSNGFKFGDPRPNYVTFRLEKTLGHDGTTLSSVQKYIRCFEGDNPNPNPNPNLNRK